MKKILMIAVAALLFSAQSMAQDPQLTPEQKEQRKALRMENRCIQLSVALALDDATAVRFTEVYKRYKADMRAVRKQFKMKRYLIKCQHTALFRNFAGNTADGFRCRYCKRHISCPIRLAIHSKRMEFVAIVRCNLNIEGKFGSLQKFCPKGKSPFQFF